MARGRKAQINDSEKLSGGEAVIEVKATLSDLGVPVQDLSEEDSEREADAFIINYLRRNGPLDYEWNRPVSLTGNLCRIVSLRDIASGKVTYIGGSGLFEMPPAKQAKLVIARMKNTGGVPPITYGPRVNFKTVEELVERIERYDERANDIVRNVLGTCRAILVWYEQYYRPSE